MLPNRPHAIRQLVRDDVGRDLARLGGLEGLGRSMLVTVLPLSVVGGLGSKTAVTNVYFAGSCLALVATLNVERLETWLPRRWVITAAIAGAVVANAIVIATDSPLLVIAVALANTQAAIFAVLISLFIMDYIGKQDLARNEGRRMVHNGAAWMIGPLLAITLYTEVASWLPFLVSGTVMLVALAYFWKLRLGPNPVLITPKSVAPSPLANIPRYFRQRYLRIAYCVTLTRGIFWSALFLYCPLYILEADLPEKMTGGIVSVTAALLLLSPLVLTMVERTSTRAVIIAGFAVIAASMGALTALGEAEPLGLVFWVTGALGASWLDVVGNIPFMRTVKPRERTTMTTVFSSWRETALIAAPGLGAIALWLGDFRLYYGSLACLALLTAVYVTYLPQRL